MASKTSSVRSHFKRRCLQRLGYIPDENNLIKKIQDNKLPFFEKQSNRVSKWCWTDPLSDTKCILVYDKDRKQLVTVLFEDLMGGFK